MGGGLKKVKEIIKDFLTSCFAAGTPLLVPGGHKLIEDFREGDWVLALPEDDFDAVPVPRMVEAVFENYTTLMRLRIGRVEILTTIEHPFWVEGRGWTLANLLVEGDRLKSHDGSTVVLTGVDYSAGVGKVYNLCISEYHTFFVGEATWGFSVWTHNAGKKVPGVPSTCGPASPPAAPVPSAPVPKSAAPIQGSGGPGKVYEIPGSELKDGKPYIGKTKQKNVSDRMKNKDHKAKTPTGDPPKATTLAENMTVEEAAGVEALLIMKRGLNNLANKIPGLNPKLLKNAPRIQAGKKVLGL